VGAGQLCAQPGDAGVTNVRLMPCTTVAARDLTDRRQFYIDADYSEDAVRRPRGVGAVRPPGG
jgi:hypothetical protein